MVKGFIEAIHFKKDKTDIIVASGICRVITEASLKELTAQSIVILM